MIIVEQSHASEGVKTAPAVANWVIWILFGGEAALMLGFSADRRGWAERHELELAVVILTPPIPPPVSRPSGSCACLRLLRLMVAVRL